MARVLHIIDSLGLGGAQSVIKSYFESRPDDTGIYLFGLRTVSNAVRIAHPNVECHPAESRFSLAPLARLRHLIASERIEILHCHLFRSQVFGTVLKGLGGGKVRLVFHEHGRAVGQEEPLSEVIAFRSFIRTFARTVDAFVCNSELARDGIVRLAPAAQPRTRVVPNPIAPLREPLIDRRAARATYDVPESAFVVGFAGRLVEPKGWRDYLHAIKLAAGKHPVFYLLAGEGRDRSRVVAAIEELQLEQSGRLLGHVADMNTFYRALDCLVMASRWEPHGLTHLEAQAHGVPVIVANVPGMSATVHAEHDALLFEAANVDALGEAICRLVEDTELRERLSKNGPANAARFTMDKFVEGLEEAYDATLRAYDRHPRQTGNASKRL